MSGVSFFFLSASWDDLEVKMADTQLDFSRVLNPIKFECSSFELLDDGYESFFLLTAPPPLQRSSTRPSETHSPSPLPRVRPRTRRNTF